MLFRSPYDVAGIGYAASWISDAHAEYLALGGVDGFIGDGYGIPSAASHEAQHLAAQTEALFVDHTYTAKALAALIAYVRAGRFAATETVLFWHTGGQVGLFA